MTFETIYSDCVDPDFNSTIPTQRRQDILIGLRRDIEPLFTTTTQFVIHCHNEFQTFITNHPNATSTQRSSHPMACILNDLLIMLLPIFTFLKSDEVLRLKPELLNILTFITVPEFQMNSLNLLAILTNHRLAQFDTFGAILERICGTAQGCRQFLSAREATDDYELNDILILQTLYSQSIVNFLYYNIPHFINSLFTSSPSHRQLRTVFFEIIIAVIRCPSVLLAYTLLPQWLTIFHDTELMSVLMMSDVCKTLLQGV